MAYQNLPWLSVQPADFADSFAKGIGLRLQRENREQDTALQLAQMAQQRDLEMRRLAAGAAERADRFFLNNDNLALAQQEQQMQSQAQREAIAQRAREAEMEREFNLGKLAMEANSKQSLFDQARERMMLDAEKLDAQFSNRDAEFGLKTAAQQLAEERQNQLREFQTGSLENDRASLLLRGNKDSGILKIEKDAAAENYKEALKSRSPKLIAAAKAEYQRLFPAEPVATTPTPAISAVAAPLQAADPLQAIDAEVAATMARNPNMSLADSLALTREASQRKQALLDAQRQGGVKVSPVNTTPTDEDVAYLVKHPEKKDKFEKRFGFGSATPYLK